MKNPIPILKEKGPLAVRYWIEKEFFENEDEDLAWTLSRLPEKISILKKQSRSGYWYYPDKRILGPHSYLKKFTDTIDTIKTLIDLGATIKDASIQSAISYLFRTQSIEGAFCPKGSPSNAPYFTGLALEILCLLGLDEKQWVQQGFKWLMNCRQNDGGWVLPSHTTDPNSPSNHLITCTILRALAASSTWKKSKEANQVAIFMRDRMFTVDPYDKKTAKNGLSHWFTLEYPLRFPNILNVLDSLSKLGFYAKSSPIINCLLWLEQMQGKDGLWLPTKPQNETNKYWLTLNIARIMKLFGLISV